MHSKIHQDSIPGNLTSKKISFFSQSLAAFPHCCFPNSLADYDDWSIKPPLTPRITQLAIAVVNYRLDNCDSLFFCQFQNHLSPFSASQCFCKRFGWQGLILMFVHPCTASCRSFHPIICSHSPFLI